MISKTKITTFQLFILLIHAQIGVGVISLPYNIFIKANSDSWISVLATGLIVQVVIVLYGILLKRFPSTNLYGIVQILFGKIIGKVLIILYSIFYMFFAILILAQFVYILKAWMMPHTPKWILLALMCFTAFFIVKEKLQIIARFTVISSVVFIVLIGSIAYALKYANFTYILPVAANGIMPIIQGVPPSLFAFQGFELLLIIYPFVQSTHKKVLRVATIANICITLFYLFLVVVSILLFSAAELKLVPQPVLYLVKAFSFRIIERPDLLFTSMWIIFVATTLIGIVYASSLGLATITRSEKIRTHAIIVVFICFCGAMIFNDMYTLRFITKIHDHLIVPIFWAFPIVLLLISVLFNKKEEVKSE